MRILLVNDVLQMGGAVFSTVCAGVSASVVRQDLLAYDGVCEENLLFGEFLFQILFSGNFARTEERD